MADAPPPVTDRRPPARLSLRFAALATAGGLMVLLPLGEVWRYHGAELKALNAERAALDPLSQALAVQRGLLSHDPVAARVLAGRLQLEPERRLRQADVDAALWDLRGTLSAGLWTRALGEATQMTQDWRDLARRVTLRQTDAAASQASHRLLVEQVLQVMDLVTGAASPPGQNLHAASWLALRQAADRGDTAQLAALVAATESGVQAQSRQLDERIEQHQQLRQQQSAGLVALGLALAAWLWWTWRRANGSLPPTEGPAGAVGVSDVRRSHGRRTTDAVPHADETRHLLWNLRRGHRHTAAHPPDTLPPRG